MIIIGQKLTRLYYFKFYINLALRPPYVRSVLFVSQLNYKFSMNNMYCIAHSTRPSTRISRELAFTIGASPSLSANSTTLKSGLVDEAIREMRNVKCRN